MSNIVPQYINDRLNNMFEYIKDLYKAFVSFTQNFYIDSNKNISINGTSVEIKSIINTNTKSNINLYNSGNISINGNSVEIKSDNNSNINLDNSGNIILNSNSIEINSTQTNGIIRFNFNSNQHGFMYLTNSPPTSTTSVPNGTMWIDFSSGKIYMYINSTSGWIKFNSSEYTPT